MTPHETLPLQISQKGLHLLTSKESLEGALKEMFLWNNILVYQCRNELNRARPMGSLLPEILIPSTPCPSVNYFPLASGLVAVDPPATSLTFCGSN